MFAPCCIDKVYSLVCQYTMTSWFVVATIAPDRLVTKLINVVFVSWHCLFVSRINAPTRQHRRANNHPAVVPKPNAASRCLVRIKPSQGLSRVAFQCLPTAALDLYRQLSLLITCVHPVVFGMPAFIAFPDGALTACIGEWRGDGEVKGQDDIKVGSPAES